MDGGLPLRATWKLECPNELANDLDHQYAVFSVPSTAPPHEIHISLSPRHVYVLFVDVAVAVPTDPHVIDPPPSPGY